MYVKQKCAQAPGRTLARWQQFLVLCAGVHHSLQLQLAELAAGDHLTRERVKQRIVCEWQLDGAATQALCGSVRAAMVVPRRV